MIPKAGKMGEIIAQMVGRCRTLMSFAASTLCHHFIFSWQNKSFNKNGRGSQWGMLLMHQRAIIFQISQISGAKIVCKSKIPISPWKCHLCPGWPPRSDRWKLLGGLSSVPPLPPSPSSSPSPPPSLSLSLCPLPSSSPLPPTLSHALPRPPLSLLESQPLPSMSCPDWNRRGLW